METEPRSDKMSENSQRLAELDRAAVEIIAMRKTPLLVLYYDDSGWMDHTDVKDIYEEFQNRNWSRDEPHANLDVLIHTLGGDPNAGYRIAQVIRDFASNVVFLVPEESASAGTLTCLCGNQIRLGAYACLGPIDISVTSTIGTELELASIEYFKRFAIDCCRDILTMMEQKGFEGETEVESTLLAKLAEQVGPTNIGRFYREKDLTGHYAQRLMLDYMFQELPDRLTLADEITSKLLTGFPSHDFSLDYHMCKGIRLPVVEMKEKESKSTKALVSLLDTLSEEEIVCQNTERNGTRYKAPFIRLYEQTRVVKDDGPRRKSAKKANNA